MNSTNNTSAVSTINSEKLEEVSSFKTWQQPSPIMTSVLLRGQYDPSFGQTLQVDK
ncbi:hypothetical protein DPMN_020591 [Dreissena polymorpha]|uniref:Uncharacterized protein n=1 Tax=Dreissena polymorpha TaxID=45954 RepID=A0A9D4S8D1_DREPO|nr:hypothetical protein DPMN_020591 [Dreissena polymorpha]